MSTYTRCIAIVGSLWDLLWNRDHATGTNRLGTQELSVAIDDDGTPGIYLEHERIAGAAKDHGAVANEAAMLALHTAGGDALETLYPRYVSPGDSCARADDPGWRWHCIAGHGTTLADWERRPLAGALAGHTHAISAVTGLTSALDGKQATLVNAAALARISALPAGPLLWDGAEISGGSSGAQYTAPSMHFIATAALAADGSTPADGAAVAALLDSSGNELIASQATAANRPIFRASAINGRPAIEFPAGQYARLEIPSLYRSDWVAAGGMEMIAVLRRLAAGVTCPFVWYVQSSLETPLWVLTYTDGLTYYDWVNQTSGRVSVSGSISTSLDWMILGCRRASGRSVLSLNGVDVATGAYYQLLYPPTTARDFSLGSSDFSGNCQLAEILFWPGALSLAERAGRVAALASQYGLAL